jgi:hypothetical protein
MHTNCPIRKEVNKSCSGIRDEFLDRPANAALRMVEAGQSSDSGVIGDYFV